MDNNKLYMMAVLLGKRSCEAPEVQKVFTKYGDCILSRLGIHECAETMGVISLNIKSNDEYIERFTSELESIDGVSVKHMALS